MKNIFRLSLLLLLASCSSVKKSTVIPYVINLNTEKSIYNEILKTDKNIAFYVEHLSDETLKFHLITPNDKERLQSNRKLFINNKFYSIIFDSDYWFYSEMRDDKPIISFESEKNVYKDIPIPSIQEREQNPEAYGYKKRSIIIDNSIYWIVDKKGKLLGTNSIKSGNVSD